MNSLFSKTSEAQTWLQQFESKDIEAATVLLDSIIFVSYQELTQGIQSHIAKLSSEFPDEHFAIFATREANKGEIEYFVDKPTKPLAVYGTAGVGSEGILANLVRDVCRNKGKLHDHPSLDEIKEYKCKWIVCVDDIVASGNRTCEFVKWLYRCPTIKSWHSTKFINFASISYAASYNGLKKLEANKLIVKLLYEQVLNYGRAFWTQQERESVENLLKRYAKREKFGYALGYKRALTLITFEHKCPNTAPAILWKSNEKWQALFPNARPLNWPEKQSKPHDLLRRLGHSNISESVVFDKLGLDSKDLILLLEAISSRKRETKVLSAFFGIKTTEIEEMVSILHNLELITQNRYISPNGLSLLRKIRKCKSKEKTIELKTDFYYPETLRSPT